MVKFDISAQLNKSKKLTHSNKIAHSNNFKLCKSNLHIDKIKCDKTLNSATTFRIITTFNTIKKLNTSTKINATIGSTGSATRNSAGTKMM